MYSSDQHDYQKYSASSAPPLFSQPTVPGIPVNSASQPYDGNFLPSQHVQPGVQAPSQPYDGNLPPAQHFQPGVLEPWSSSLCDCCSDGSNCCMTCWCPCVTFGLISKIVDRGSCLTCVANGALYALINLLIGCGCLCSCIYRSKMRHRFKLQGDCCGDCLIHFFCECCALCQEYRELQNSRSKMIIGWQGNLERQNGVMMAPVIPGGMNR